MYPRNSREIGFLSTADCRATFARLMRELDKLDEEGVFGPFGWRDRLAGPPPSTKSMSGEYRDQLALAGSSIGGASDFGSEGCQFDPDPASQPLDFTHPV